LVKCLVQHQRAVLCSAPILPHPPGRYAIGRKPFRFPSFKPSPQSRLSLILSTLPIPHFFNSQAPFTRLRRDDNPSLRAKLFDLSAIYLPLTCNLLIAHEILFCSQSATLKSNWPALLHHASTIPKSDSPSALCPLHNNDPGRPLRYISRV
jgi:hypothetical protein